MTEGASVLAAQTLCCSRLVENRSFNLRDIDLVIAPGSLTVLWGDDGCGKNLLLRLLGLLERPDSGDVRIGEKPTSALSDCERAALRSNHFGFLFARPFLLPSFSIIENVAMPLFKIASASVEEAYEKTHKLLERFSLSRNPHNTIDQLPFAQQQRVALARALVHSPDFLLIEDFDKTVEQDSALTDLIREVRKESGLTVVLSAQSDRFVDEDHFSAELSDGFLISAAECRDQ
jgi:lipoprotein-releasing system ATP-binding protein